MPTDRKDYQTPKVPPATPPTVDPDAEPVDARELALDDGDAETDGHANYQRPDHQSEIDKEREGKIERWDKHDGKGEPEMDALPPD